MKTQDEVQRDFEKLALRRLANAVHFMPPQPTAAGDLECPFCSRRHSQDARYRHYDDCPKKIAETILIEQEVLK